MSDTPPDPDSPEYVGDFLNRSPVLSADTIHVVAGWGGVVLRGVNLLMAEADRGAEVWSLVVNLAGLYSHEQDVKSFLRFWVADQPPVFAPSCSSVLEYIYRLGFRTLAFARSAADCYGESLEIHPESSDRTVAAFLRTHGPRADFGTVAAAFRTEAARMYRSPPLPRPLPELSGVVGPELQAWVDSINARSAGWVNMTAEQKREALEVRGAVAAADGNPAGAAGKGGGGGAGAPRKQPSDDAIAVYRLWMLKGGTQEELARLYTQDKRPVNQGTVSRWLSEVTAWLAAGNVLPDLAAASDQRPITMDPERIDLGANREGRAQSQRKRRTSDPDE